MELKIKFDGQSLLLAAIAIACAIGIYHGGIQAVNANDVLSEARATQETITKIRNRQIDIQSFSLQDTLAIGAINMQLLLNPNYLEDMAESAKKDLIYGVFLLLISISALGALVIYYKRKQPA